jgi:hypothetical protein
MLLAYRLARSRSGRLLAVVVRSSSGRRRTPRATLCRSARSARPPVMRRWCPVNGWPLNFQAPAGAPAPASAAAPGRTSSRFGYRSGQPGAGRPGRQAPRQDRAWLEHFSGRAGAWPPNFSNLASLSSLPRASGQYYSTVSNQCVLRYLTLPSTGLRCKTANGCAAATAPQRVFLSILVLLFLLGVLAVACRALACEQHECGRDACESDACDLALEVVDELEHGVDLGLQVHVVVAG